MSTSVAVLEGNRYAQRDTLAFDRLPEGWEPWSDPKSLLLGTNLGNPSIDSTGRVWSPVTGARGCPALRSVCEGRVRRRLRASVRRCDGGRLVAGREQHLFRTQLDFDRGVRTVAENGLTGGIGTTLRPGQRLLFRELLGFSGPGQRHG
jgi:hypothetical protein